MTGIDEITGLVEGAESLQLPTEADPVAADTSAVAPEDQWIYDEFDQALGRPPTQDEFNNWKKYGHPGQILIELGGGMKTVTTESGQIVKVYTDLSPAGSDFEFNYSNKEGEVFAVPEGTRVASGNNYKLIGTKDGFDIYGNAGEQSGGVLGSVDNLLGTDLSGIADKAIPNELKSGVLLIPGVADPLDITQTMIYGDKFNQEGLKSVADVTGLKPSEVGQVQNYAKTGAKIAAAFIPGIGPFLSAGLDIADNVAQSTGNEQPWSETGKQAGLDLIIASAMTRFTTGSWLPPMAGTPPVAPVPAGQSMPGEPVVETQASNPGDIGPIPEAEPGSISPVSAPEIPTIPEGGMSVASKPGSPAGGVPGASSKGYTVVPDNAQFVDTAGNASQPPSVAPPKGTADFLSTVPDGMQATVTVGPNGTVQNMVISPKPVPPPAPTSAWLQYGIPAGAVILGAGLQFYGSMLALKKQETAMKEAAKLQKEALKYQNEWQQAQLDAETQMFYDQLEAEKGSSTPHDSGSMYTKGSV